MPRRISLKTLAVASFMTGTALQSAWAWEAEAVAERFQALTGEQNINLNWSGVRQEGNSVVLEGLEFAVPGAFDPIQFGELALDDVTEDDTSYRIGSIVIDSFNHSKNDAEIDIQGFETQGLILPKEGVDDPFAGMVRYDSMSITSITAGDGGADPFIAIRDAVVENQLGDDEISFTGSAEAFSLDFLPLTDGSAKTFAALEELGYEQLEGRFDVAGSWTPADGRMILSRYEVEMAEAGALNVTGDISGYTPEFIKAMREAQDKMNAASEQEKEAQGMAMLGLMQQLSLHGATIRFDDASLTGKLLDYVAKQQGGSPEAVADQAKAIVPLMAGQYLGPDLTVSLTKAVTAYLDDPQNLEIRIAPEEPMPFALLMGVGMSSPEALAEQVGLQILANQ